MYNIQWGGGHIFGWKFEFQIRFIFESDLASGRFYMPTRIQIPCKQSLLQSS